jgi:ribosome-binding protein aMBF1 (putative translation factor)
MIAAVRRRGDVDGTMPRKNPYISDESPDEYVRRRGARDPEFAVAFEEEFDKLRLAREIRLARERRNLSQTELAERVGTKQPHIARLELGKALPRLDVLHKIAAALGFRLEVRLREVAATKTAR